MKDIFNLISGPHGLILLGGILTLIGAFWSSKQESNNEKELNKKNLIIIEKTEEISELNSKIVGVLTGGESYPMVMFGTPDRINGIPSLSITGENAISNVSGTLIDIRELRRMQRLGQFRTYKGHNFYKNIISPAYSMLLKDEKFVFQINKSCRFLIHFYTPYNNFSQEIAIEMDTINNWPLQAYKIYKGNNRELIHTHYPENFPIPLKEIDFLEALTQEELDRINDNK